MQAAPLDDFERAEWLGAVSNH
ncbi:hypothetical protein A2U01_0117425, partial [Trifolium medium]|nr:hypothetical protein [Trifolium medium]